MNVKKFASLFICLLVFVTCGLAGCAGFSIDKVRYYNEVIAKVGDKEITRHELLIENSGYIRQYMNYGQTEKEAIKTTLDGLISNESLYQYAVAYKDPTTNEKIYRPTAYQVNDIVKSIYEDLDESIMTDYITNAKILLDIKSEKESTDENIDPTSYNYTDYKYSPRATIIYEDGKYKIDYIETDKTSLDCVIKTESLLTEFEKDEIVIEIKDGYLNSLKEKLQKEEGENATIIYNKAINQFTDALMNYEKYLRDGKGKAYNTVTDDLIYRYFERTFDSMIKQQYITNIRTNYLKNEELSIEKLTKKYNSIINKNYTMYNHVDDHESYKTAIKDIGTEGDTILYHPDMTDDTKFGYFIHTLINFTEDQKTAIKNVELIKDEDQRQTAYNNLINETTVTKREKVIEYVEGEEIIKYVENGDTATLSEVLHDYSIIYNMPNDQYRREAFINFMFTYTGDTGTMSAGMPYVVGNNGHSAMETAFTNESVKLMETGVAGAMTSYDLTNVEDIVTSYGIHFVMYIDEVSAYDIAYGSDVYIQSNNRESDPAGAHNLFGKTLNPLTGETYFDMLFDEVYPASSSEIYTSNTGYSEEEERIITISQKTNKVTKYTTKIKATKASI